MYTLTHRCTSMKPNQAICIAKLILTYFICNCMLNFVKNLLKKCYFS